MAKILVNDPGFNQQAAQKFLERLRKAMTDQPSGNHCALAAMSELYEILTEVSNSYGWCVSVDTVPGLDFDLFDGVTREEWDAMIEACDQDLTSLNTNSIEASRKAFMETLVLQVLTNVPPDVEKAKYHILANIASVFNGMNIPGLRFALTFIDYDMFDGDFAESQNLADLLVVSQ